MTREAGCEIDRFVEIRRLNDTCAPAQRIPTRVRARERPSVSDGGATSNLGTADLDRNNGLARLERLKRGCRECGGPAHALHIKQKGIRIAFG